MTKMPLKALQQFIRTESSAGILLVFATLLALMISNSPLFGYYESFRALPLVISLGTFSLDKPLLLWINDGLMAVFFLLIGLEIKREVLEGELSSRDQLLLPAAAAVGGFVLPALIFVFFNSGDSSALDGWAIPAATDIAFALGVLALLGSRVPLALKIFLTSVAIFDDIAAIIVIAAFYTADLSLLSLTMAALGIAVLIALNVLGVSRLAAFILVGIVVWIAVLKSGVHATLAGFVLGLTIPLTVRDVNDPAANSPLRALEHSLHPWVAFGIMPVFAFTNAGISFTGIDSSVVFSPVAIGIVAGLFLGKQWVFSPSFGYWFASVWPSCQRGPIG